MPKPMPMLRPVPMLRPMPMTMPISMPILDFFISEIRTSFTKIWFDYENKTTVNKMKKIL